MLSMESEKYQDLVKVTRDMYQDFLLITMLTNVPYSQFLFLAVRKYGIYNLYISTEIQDYKFISTDLVNSELYLEFLIKCTITSTSPK